MTNEELRLFAVDHLMYELTMFLKHDSALATDIIVMNALLESFTIHVRLLALFLYQKPNPKWPNDVTAEHYVKDIHAWRTARGAPPSELQIVIDRTGREIAHLTTGRRAQGDPKRDWPLEPAQSP